jgi:hypothetical protein
LRDAVAVAVAEPKSRWLQGVVERTGLGWTLFKSVLLLWLATRLGYMAITFLATTLHLYQMPAEFTGLVLSWERWDAGWYMSISRLGYFSPQSINFFPLYPATVGATSWLLGHGSGPVWPQPDKLRLLVAMGWSNLALLVALLALAHLAEFESNIRESYAGIRAAQMALAFPFAMAWTIAYAEGFFFALAALTLLFARQGRWYAAAATAFLAGLDRPVAVILILPLAWEYGRQQGWRWPLIRGAVVVSAVPLALLAYCTYAYLRFGNFFLPIRSQFTYWHHISMPQWQTLKIAMTRISSRPQDASLLALEVVLLTLCAILVLVNIRRVPFLYTLYMAGLIYLATAAPVPSQYDLLWGTGRYLAQAIPIYLIAASQMARRPWLETPVVSGAMLLQGALLIALFQGKPVL